MGQLIPPRSKNNEWRSFRNKLDIGLDALATSYPGRNEIKYYVVLDWAGDSVCVSIQLFLCPTHYVERRNQRAFTLHLNNEIVLTIR